MVKTIDVGSDFSGVGAFEQALKRLQINYNVVFACDKDKYVRKTYIHNYGEPGYFPEDVYEREIPEKPLDIYMTSPPCQAFSFSGKREGEDDERGVLFYNSHHFIKENMPRFFIFENVKGLLSDDKGNPLDQIGRTFRRWLDYLGGKTVNGNPVIFPHEESVPYHIYFKVLNATDFGVPQSRERVFIIGIRDDADNDFCFPKPFPLVKSIKDILEPEVDRKYFLSEKYTRKITFNGKKQGVIADLNVGGQKGEVFSQDSRIISCLSASDYKQPKQVFIGAYRGRDPLNPKNRKKGAKLEQTLELNSQGISNTLTSVLKDNMVVTENREIRRLTAREYFRLMDFPETFSWPVSDTQAYKQAGNSIVVNVLCELIKKLKL